MKKSKYEERIHMEKSHRSVQRLRDEPITAEEQLAAACTVYPYEAAQLLGARQKGNLNEVPDREWFTEMFSFSGPALKRYIMLHDGLAEKLLGLSYDQRGIPSAYMEEVEGGYQVGWFDYERSQQQFYKRIEDAATDFVLLFWGLPRWRDDAKHSAGQVEKQSKGGHFWQSFFKRLRRGESSSLTLTCEGRRPWRRDMGTIHRFTPSSVNRS